MFTFVATRRRGNKEYRYLQICRSERVNGAPRRKVLGTIGNVDHLRVDQIDSLIASLTRYASPETRLRFSKGPGQPLSAKTYGSVVAVRALWEDLRLPGMIGQGQQAFSVENAVFRLVVNRLVDPLSKLSAVEWQQEEAHWPDGGQFTYQQFLRAMDVLLPQKARLETELFARVRDLFSLPLQMVWYDLTSSYFDGDGVCPLAEYGYSRDHRADRAQIALGLAVTQEGFPIAHEVFPGSTADVNTVKGLAHDLQNRFGLKDIVVVGDRGMLSAANAAALDEIGLKYVMALRTRQHARVPGAVTEAKARGLQRPTDPEAPWTVQEIEPRNGVRHVVVYSAFRAMHDRVVRRKRIRDAKPKLAALETAVAAGRLRSASAIEARVRVILRDHHVARLVKWELMAGRLRFWLDCTQYRAQRQLDGIFVLVSNDPSLSERSIVDAYRQLREVEDAFRVLKTLVRLRPIRHHAERRVRSHVLICVLAYLIAKVLEQRLERAGVPMTAEKALHELGRIQAVEYEQAGYHIIQATEPTPTAARILRALGVASVPSLLSSHPVELTSAVE